jgi:hypothetical protein
MTSSLKGSHESKATTSLMEDFASILINSTRMAIAARARTTVCIFVARYVLRTLTATNVVCDVTVSFSLCEKSGRGQLQVGITN